MAPRRYPRAATDERTIAMTAPRLRSSKVVDQPKVEVENVNVPGQVTRVDAAKYVAMRKALLKALPARGPGLTQNEMATAVLPYLPEAHFPGGAKAMWWVKCVQLDLEAKGLIVRVTQPRPLRWHRAGRAAVQKPGTPGATRRPGTASTAPSARKGTPRKATAPGTRPR